MRKTFILWIILITGILLLAACSDDKEKESEEFAQFLTIIDESDEYFFRKIVGNIGAGYSNQVVWTISTEDAK